MSRSLRSVIAGAALAAALLAAFSCRAATTALPKPSLTGGMALDEALAARRSVRSYRSEALTLREVSQLLWAAQGVTSQDGKRTSPSAHALYPLTLWLVAGSVAGLPAGVYRYLPASHALQTEGRGDLREKLVQGARMQAFVREAPASIVIAVDGEAMARFGDRGRRFADLEVGHAAQNALLEAVALGLGSVPVGSFDAAALDALLKLPQGSAAAYVLPVGHPR